METDVAVKLKEVEDRSKSNTHRLNKLEQLTNAIYEQNTNIASLVTELKHTNESIARHERDIDAHSARIRAIEHRPGKLWDKLLFGILGALATGIGAAVVALIIK